MYNAKIRLGNFVRQTDGHQIAERNDISKPSQAG
jgi:hypothetical protein